MTDETLGTEIRRSLDEVWRPAPALLSSSMTAVRQSRQSSHEWVRGAFAIGIAVAVIVALVLVRNLTQAPPRTTAAPRGLPAPSPVPITHTDPAGQVAWVAVSSSKIVGIDPRGTFVAQLNVTVNPYLIYRTPDGTRLVAFEDADVAVYSARDGSLTVRIPRSSPTGVVSDVFSPDGRYLAALGTGGRLEVFDLSKSRQVGTVVLPGASSGPAWSSGNVVFAGPSTIYAITDWSGPAHLTRLVIDAAGVRIVATAIEGQSGHNIGSCAGPGMLLKALPDEQTLVTFCHADGTVTFLDGTRLTRQRTLQPLQDNPYFLNPIFTPDMHLLYLQAGNSVQVVDLEHQRNLGPEKFPSTTSEPGAFAWLGVLDVEAGGVASSMPISPDGLRIYQATNDGITIYRVPDLKLLGRVGAGVNVDEVWVSSDGKTLFATIHGGGLLVLPSDGTGTSKQIPTGGSTYQQFIAPTHG